MARACSWSTRSTRAAVPPSRQNAKSKGVATIDYDRLTLNGSSSYYVSFDNEVVGEKIGQGLVDCVKQWNVQKPKVLEMDGDPTDNNATLFAEGYNSVLKPEFDSGAYVKVGEPAGTWDSQKALTNFQQQFTAHPNINSVVTANDTLANSVISVLKTDKIPAKTIPTTGQDATLVGLQNILTGYQCMYGVQADLRRGAGSRGGRALRAGRADTLRSRW